MRLSDKFTRLKNLAKGGRALVGDESLLDTLRDIRNYAYLYELVLGEEAPAPPTEKTCPQCGDHGYWYPDVVTVRANGVKVHSPGEEIPCEVCGISPFSKKFRTAHRGKTKP